MTTTSPPFVTRGVVLDMMPPQQTTHTHTSAIAIPINRPNTPPPHGHVNGRTSDISASSISSTNSSMPSPSPSQSVFPMGTPTNTPHQTQTIQPRPHTPVIAGLTAANLMPHNHKQSDQPSSGRLVSPGFRPPTPLHAGPPSFSVSPVSIGVPRPNSSGASSPHPLGLDGTSTPRVPQSLSERLKMEMAAMRVAKEELSASLPEWESESSSDSDGEEVVVTNGRGRPRGDSTPGSGSPNAGIASSLSMPATPLAAGYMPTTRDSNNGPMAHLLRPPTAPSPASGITGAHAILRGSPTMSPAKGSPNTTPGGTPISSPSHHKNNQNHHGGLAAALVAAKKIPAPATPVTPVTPATPASTLASPHQSATVAAAVAAAASIATPTPISASTAATSTIASGTLVSPQGAAGLISTPAKRAGSMMVASFSGSLLGAAPGPNGSLSTPHHVRRGSTGESIPEHRTTGHGMTNNNAAAMAHAKMSLRERRAMLMTGGSGSTLAVATNGPQAAAGGLGPIGYDMVASPRGGVVFAGTEAASPRRPTPLLVGETISPRPGSAHGSAQASPMNAAQLSASNRARVSRIGSLFMAAGSAGGPSNGLVNNGPDGPGALSMLENHVRGHIKKSIIANDREREVQEALSHLPLEDVIATPQYCEILERFLVKNFCAENLAFIQHVQMFDKIPVEQAAKRADAANAINKRFVNSKTATQLVNIDAVTRTLLEKAIERKEYNSKLFDRALGVIYAMTSKDVYRRFCGSKEYKAMIDDPVGTSDAYILTRLNKFDFRFWNQEEDFEFVDDLAQSVANGGLPKKHRLRLKKYRKSFTGEELIDWFIYKSFSRTRLAAVSLAQRLHECGRMIHVSDSHTPFEDAKDQLYHLQDAKEIGATWPSVTSLLQQADVVYGEVLLRGVFYHRLWAVISKEHHRIYMYRSSDHLVPHSSINLKNASVTLHTATRAATNEMSDWMGGEAKVSEPAIPGVAPIITPIASQPPTHHGHTSSTDIVVSSPATPASAGTPASAMSTPSPVASSVPPPSSASSTTADGKEKDPTEHICYIQIHKPDGRNHVFLLETEQLKAGWLKILKSLSVNIAKREWAISV